jgi:IS605 OrfB family transposase
MAVSCVRTVIAKYKTILENQKEWIKPVFRLPQLDLVWNRDYSLNAKNGIFSVNTLSGRIKVSFYKNGFEQYFSDNCKFGTAKLVNKHGKFFLHIPVTYEISELNKSEVSNVVGIDRGIRFLAATYDSKGKSVFYDGNIVKQKRAHYKVLRKQLQQVGTPSSRRRLKAIGQRENRWMRDVNHCISKALATSNPDGSLFVIEDLSGIRSVTERIKVKNRYVMVSWSYYDLEQKLVYKALKNHQAVIKADPKYTSQTCPKCGHTEKGNRNKHKHIFCCKNCGYKSNDDRIGAMNLHRMGIDYLNGSLVPDAVATE